MEDIYIEANQPMFSLDCAALFTPKGIDLTKETVALFIARAEKPTNDGNKKAYLS